MKEFRFHGKDVTSDRGTFEVVIRAESLIVANSILQAHLAVLERLELLPVARLAGVRSAQTEGVTHSDVERRHEEV